MTAYFRADGRVLKVLAFLIITRRQYADFHAARSLSRGDALRDYFSAMFHF